MLMCWPCCRGSRGFRAMSLLLKKMWRDILLCVGSVSLLRPLWVASWPIGGFDLKLETLRLVLFTPLLKRAVEEAC
jgi:hypothetical protein